MIEQFNTGLLRAIEIYWIYLFAMGFLFVFTVNWYCITIVWKECLLAIHTSRVAVYAKEMIVGMRKKDDKPQATHVKWM